MGRISEEDITRVREATDIVSLIGEYVELRQRGRDYWGNCPFHEEKTPSFKASPTTQTWHCFGCGEGGDAFRFLMMREQFDFPESVRHLAQKAGITISEEEGGLPRGYRSRLFAACEAAASFYHTQLMRGKAEGCTKAREYLGSRGFGGEIPNTWNLGYAPGSGSLVTYLRGLGFSSQEMIDANLAFGNDRGGIRDRFYNRVMFPIRDLQGRTIAFGGRVIGKGEPKYINTSNCPLFSKRSNLFGIDFAKTPIVSKGASIVVEGYTDVIAMHAAGFTNTVATLGTALTPQHVKLLTRFATRVVYLFDGDAAGQKAADRAAELITSAVAPESGGRQLSLDVAVIPDGMDPVEFIDARGAEAMSSLLDGAESLLRFVLDRRMSEIDMSTPESRVNALPSMLAPLVPIRDSILADEYVNYIADMFKLDFSRVRRELMGLKTPRRKPEGMDGRRSDTVIVTAPEPQVPRYSVPTEGAGRWEAQIIAAYALQPQIRTRIATGMRDASWSIALHALLFEKLLDLGSDAPSDEAVSACMVEFPESEPIWSISIPGISDPHVAEEIVDVMIREWGKASLADQIRDLENRFKHDRSLDDAARHALFEQVSALQKQLVEMCGM